MGVREIDLTMVNNSELRENWLKSSDLNSIYEELGSQMNVSVEGALQVDTVCQCWMRLHWGQYKSPRDLMISTLTEDYWQWSMVMYPKNCLLKYQKNIKPHNIKHLLSV
jgi:hypothetical protein